MWKLNYSLALSYCLLFPLACAFSQDRPIKFKNFSKEDGLASTDITSIAQTADGYLWIGTSDGLNRFDGYQFTVYRNDPKNQNSIADNNITSLYVDKSGALWIGTQTSGVSRYDNKTESFKNYKSILYDKHTLSNYYVVDIEEDSNGILWIATALGLNKYDAENDNFERYFHQVSISISGATIDSVKEHVPDDKIIPVVSELKGRTFSDESALEKALLSKLSEDEVALCKMSILKNSLLRVTADKIRIIESDEAGNLWLGYEKNGLAYFNPTSNVLNVYSSDNGSGFWDKEIRSFYVDGKNLWIGTRDGKLAKFNIAERKLTNIPLEGESNNVEAITKDSNGVIWLGDDYGLTRITNGHSYRYQNEEGNKYSLLSSSIKVIFEDRQHNLWVGCSQGGLSLAVNNSMFDHYKHDENSLINLSKNHVSSVLEDSEGNVWIGYYTMGIDVWNRKTNTITRFNYSAESDGGIGKGTVFAIFEDRHGVIWIGTYEGGLQYFDKKTNQFVSLLHIENDETSISGNDVRSITEDQDGNLWIAVHGHGVNKIDRNTLRAVRYFADYDNHHNSLGNDWVYCIHVDRNGNVWAGTVFGLSVLYKGSSHFITFNRENSNLSHDHVRTISEDSKGNLWFGTHNGLTLFNPQTKQFTIYNQKSGLPNNTIHGVLEDSKGYLWVSTNNGISRLDYVTNKALNFSELDGLQGAEFFTTSCNKGKSGAMYFGGTNGLNVFFPENLSIDSMEIPVVFSSLTLFNQPVTSGSSVLKNSINEEREITFESDENVFSISYVGLSYKDAAKIHYAYQLEGFDQGWNYVGTRREATYTNLDPGVYTFKVLASNSSGIWNKTPRSISIRVLPPIWRTSWAYTFYALAIIGFLYLYRKANIAREKLRNDIRLKELEAQKTHEIDTMKLRFFTNISHEFKTPLTLINSPVETLLNRDEDIPEAKRFEFYHLIHRNAQRLLRLINQLLDLSAIEAGFMQLKVSKQDIVSFCKNITSAFSFAADSTGIHYEFKTNVNDAEVYFDQDKVEKILYNLISNAVKFTLQGGKVTVTLNVVDGNVSAIPGQLKRLPGHDNHYVQLQIEDTGIGIAEEIKSKVFERFYQGDHSIAQKNGTGIGLALTKQLVERHYGIIDVESLENRGSCFTVWLPVSQSHFSNAEIINTSQSTERENTKAGFIPKNQPFQLNTTGNTNPIVLLVEDNEDLRRFVKLNLEGDYIIHEGSSGKDGFEKAIDLNPDLIISDVVMPDGNGFELCNNIKKDKRTSHILFILLTARGSETHHLEGLNSGAEDYIAKPFNMAILKARVRNLIQARQKIKDKFYSDLNFDPGNLASNSLDKSFVNQLIRNIEKNIGDESFNADILADNLSISRSQLYKKVKGLTGLSVSIFIRNIRLRKAADLLKTNALTVSEVAYEVGFSDPGYFTRCFREMYDKSPTEFMKNPVNV